MHPYYWYRGNQWTQILLYLQQSLYAGEMVCAMSSELFHIPTTKDLKGNSDMHNHLIPATYHRVTAVGSARRLANGENRQSIVETMTACIKNVEKQDKKVREGLKIMEENAPSEYVGFVKLIAQWQKQAELYLSQAKNALTSMGITFSNGSESQSEEENM